MLEKGKSFLLYVQLFFLEKYMFVEILVIMLFGDNEKLRLNS